jgi:hypothetical protein
MAESGKRRGQAAIGAARADAIERTDLSLTLGPPRPQLRLHIKICLYLYCLFSRRLLRGAGNHRGFTHDG